MFEAADVSSASRNTATSSRPSSSSNSASRASVERPTALLAVIDHRIRGQSPPEWVWGGVGGLLVAASLPPWGWWPLGLLGAAVLVTALDGQPWKRRVLAGAMFGVAQFVVGLWWMREFTLPGYILCTLLQASFFAAGAVLVHPRRLDHPGGARGRRSRPQPLAARRTAAERCRARPGRRPAGAGRARSVASS